MNAIKLTKIRLMAAALAVFAFGICLAGCGGDDATTPFSGQTLKIAKPALSKTQVFYTGSEYTVTLNPANPTAYTLRGDSSATEIGDYAATVTLVDTVNTAWADGTTAPLSLPWSIEPEKIWYGEFIPEGSWPGFNYITPFDLQNLIDLLVGIKIGHEEEGSIVGGAIWKSITEIPAATNNISYKFADTIGDCIFIVPQSQDLSQIRDGASNVCYPPIDNEWNKFPVIINEINYFVYKLKDRPLGPGSLTYTFEFN